jgi:DNA-binding NtrC family response regulator
MLKQRRKTLLIIDDEQIFCDALTDCLQSDELAVLTANTGADGLAVCSRMRIDLVLLDQKLPDGEGHALAPAILERNDQTKIIFITAFPSFENAVKAIRTGAHDYLSKPLDLEELKLMVQSMLRTLDLEQVVQIHSYEQQRDRDRAVLIGAASGLAGVEALIESATRTDAPVLITGETGTGKNLVAKNIHYRSASADAPFIAINCASLPEPLIEAELFGFERGSFTGAVAAKKGLFELADGGTIFLDEIGELPIQLQSKLLSVIEDRQVRRIGGTSSKYIKVRIIAATNADLARVLGKTFRNDLYYRLSVMTIHIPPLRERRQDIPDLAEYILKRVLGAGELSLPGQELRLLQEYDWPGNVRELRNILERALLVHQKGMVRPSLLLQHAQTGAASVSGSADQRQQAIVPLEEAERRLILAALDQYGGNVTRAAQALGISLSTMKRRLEQYRSGPD